MHVNAIKHIKNKTPKPKLSILSVRNLKETKFHLCLKWGKNTWRNQTKPGAHLL